MFMTKLIYFITRSQIHTPKACDEEHICLHCLIALVEESFPSSLRPLGKLITTKKNIDHLLEICGSPYFFSSI